MQTLRLFPGSLHRVSVRPHEICIGRARSLFSTSTAANIYALRYGAGSPGVLIARQDVFQQVRKSLRWRQACWPGVISSSFASKTGRKASGSRNGEARAVNSPTQSLRIDRQDISPKSPGLPADPVYVDDGSRPKISLDDATNKLQYTMDVGRNKLVIWSVIAIFVAVWVLGLQVREYRGVLSPEAQAKIKQAEDAGRPIRVRTGIVPALNAGHLSYRVVNWPPKDLSWSSWSPYVTSMFAHGSLMHLGLNCTCSCCFHIGFILVSRHATSEAPHLIAVP